MSTILLVQNDADAREVSAEWFRQSGFFVLECESGEEALCLAGIYRREIDIVVTELILLRMHGLRLVTKLREKRPGLRALILSGTNIPRHLREQELTFVETPYEHSALVQVVRNMIEARDPRSELLNRISRP